MRIKDKFVSFFYKIGLLSKMGRKDFDIYLEKYSSSEKTLDIGCGGSPYKKFFPNRTAVDIINHKDVDVVADVHNLSMFKDAEFENVLCTEALEHFYNPFLAISEIKRVLKKNGILILTTRFIFPLHEVPNDYFRFTEYGLKYLLKDFEIMELKNDGNTIETLGILFQRIGYQCDTLWLKPFKVFWFITAKLINIFSFVLTKQYGEINQKNIIENIMTSGYYIVAKKK
ncbi:class I SAM-dependent methyltransferase [Patescibacteria group bacterium]|nr:class I SAM-dependent methyltransferase [Patescibacteria group bacterium]